MSSVEDLLSSSPLPAVLLVTDLVVEDGESQQKTDQDDVLFVNCFLEKLKACLTADATREDKAKSECRGDFTSTDEYSFRHNFDSCYYNFGSCSLLSSTTTGYGIWSVRFAGICSFTTKYYSTNIAFWHCQYKQHNKMSFPLYVPLASSPRTTATTPTSGHSQEETSTPSCYTSTPPGSFISSPKSDSSSSCCRSGFIPRLHYHSAFSSPACLIYLCRRTLCTPANSTHDCTSVLPKVILHSPWDASPSDDASSASSTKFNDYAASFSSSRRSCCATFNASSVSSTTTTGAVDTTISTSQVKDEHAVVEDKGGHDITDGGGDVSVDGENIDIKFVVVCADWGYNNMSPYSSINSNNSGSKSTGADSSSGWGGSMADVLLYEQAKMWAADNLIETVVVRAAKVVATASDATNDGENTPPAEVADRLVFVAVDPEELSETGREKGQLPEEEEEDGRESGRYGLLSAGGAEYHTNGVERIAEALHANMWTNAVMANSRNITDNGRTNIGGVGGMLVDSGRTAAQGGGAEETIVCKETTREEEEQKDDKKPQIVAGVNKCSRGVRGPPPPPRCCGNVTPLDLDRFVGEIQNIREAGLRCSDDERRALAAETVMNIMKSLNIDEEEDEVSIMSSSCSETEDVDLAVPSV
eukprot:GHVS01095828.1.p1 GENE.GHVS01095828.1~~GHVS01095828.1.p1  ORF type:complete len:644 (+),score=182.32 GHVS01095828.1:3-1934(+)